MSEPFWIDEQDRFQRLRLIPWWQQEKLARARIMIVGAGALGNEVIKNLALLGVGHLDIVDMDRIEMSNLSRSVLFRESDCEEFKADVAARTARQFHPESHIVPIVGNVLSDVGLGLFAAADIVLGCLDNREARWWVNRCCWKTGTPWIDAGIQEIHGVLQAFAASEPPCYECGMKDLDYALANVRYSCPLLPRDDMAIGRVPTSPTIASMIGAWQAQWAVKYLHQLEIPFGHAIVVNGFSDSVYRTKLPVKEDCLSHERWEPQCNLDASYHQVPIHQLLEHLRHALELADDPQLILEREWVTVGNCATCNHEWPIEKLRLQASLDDANCPLCHQAGTPQFLNGVSLGQPAANRSLADLGIPAADWFQIRWPAGSAVIALQEPAMRIETPHVPASHEGANR